MLDLMGVVRGVCSYGLFINKGMKQIMIVFVILSIVCYVSWNSDSAKSNRLNYEVDKCNNNEGYIDYVDSKDGWIYFCNNSTYKIKY